MSTHPRSLSSSKKAHLGSPTASSIRRLIIARSQNLVEQLKSQNVDGSMGEAVAVVIGSLLTNVLRLTRIAL